MFMYFVSTVHFLFLGFLFGFCGFLWFSWFSWWGGEGDISRNKRNQQSEKLIRSSHSSISYETIQLQGNLKSGKSTSGIVLVTFLQQNEKLLENVISSHIPYGHFGSGDLPIHVKI